MENKIAAFTSWHNGGIQTSALWTVTKDVKAAVEDFIERIYASDTFASLHTFECEKEAEDFYCELKGI